MNNIFLKFFYAYCKILKFKNRKKIFLENYNMHKNINNNNMHKNININE